MFEIFLSHQAEKYCANLPEKNFIRIKSTIIELKHNPLPVKKFDVKHISGREDRYRIRIQRYRIVYEIDWNLHEINILKIDLRHESTYKNIP